VRGSVAAVGHKAVGAAGQMGEEIDDERGLLPPQKRAGPLDKSFLKNGPSHPASERERGFSTFHTFHCVCINPAASPLLHDPPVAETHTVGG